MSCTLLWLRNVYNKATNFLYFFFVVYRRVLEINICFWTSVRSILGKYWSLQKTKERDQHFPIRANKVVQLVFFMIALSKTLLVPIPAIRFRQTLTKVTAFIYVFQITFVKVKLKLSAKYEGNKYFHLTTNCFLSWAVHLNGPYCKRPRKRRTAQGTNQNSTFLVDQYAIR